MSEETPPTPPKLNPFIPHGLIVKSLNVYNMVAGEDKYIVFAVSETKAGIMLLKHLQAESVPDPFTAEFICEGRGLVLEGHFDEFITARGRVQEAESRANSMETRAVAAESTIGHHKELLEAAGKVIDELRVMLPMMAAFTKTTKALEAALANFDSIKIT